MEIAGHQFQWGSRTYIMGILNITPDSFSGDGLLKGREQSEAIDFNSADLDTRPALEQARSAIDAGVDILDVGGESTRPGSAPLSIDQELERVVPVIRDLHATFPDVLISIDTYKARVAEEGFKEGAQILNDVWGLRADPELAGMAARYKAPVVLMHNRSNPASVEVRANLGGAYIGAQYENLVEDVKRELLDSVGLAHAAGIPDSSIILDPGIGFGKTVEHNLELINRLGELRLLGYPILLGPSRKSFIGFTLDLPADQRIEGTGAAIAVGIVRGADMVRVHDVKPMVRISRMTDALVRRNDRVQA
ncbi:MAG: dihydropteroate synthase [Chloroflexi bacterium RBG_16_51_16]|nr:MAG: dihydropteroate synthase [Chloroflexi bacterium RBG_16_51_16]